MARPREFDFDKALNRATQLFWSRGYFDTSTRDVVEFLGLGRQSIYNAFGDKEALFVRCLRFYEEEILNPRFDGLESDTAGRQEIVRFLAQTVDFLDTQSDNRSCMMSIVATGARHRLPDAASAVQRFHLRMNNSFQKAVVNSSEKGITPASTNSVVISRGLACTVHGMAVVSKLGATRDELVDIASSALQPLY